MHWDQLRQQWQQSTVPCPDLTAMIHRTHADSQRLRRHILRRDGFETLLGLAMVPIFAAAAVIALGKGAWLTAAFSALLTGWLLFMPWWLWRARRRLPVVRADQPLADFLRQERHAMLDQAHLFKSTWRWNLGPAAAGVIGFYASVRGLGAATAIYAAIVLAVYVCLARYQDHIAHIRFLSRVDEIDRLLASFNPEFRP